MKKLNLIITTCLDCPYCEYYYPGYLCRNKDYKVQQVEFTDGTLYDEFPTIPKECPLEDY